MLTVANNSGGGQPVSLANIGGFIARRGQRLFEQLKNMLILIEGFPTCGGLAGRDLEAVARGLQEVLDERYLEFRIGQVQALWERLDVAGIPLVRPAGGHAVYLDAKRFLLHLPPEKYPASPPASSWGPIDPCCGRM